MPRTTLVAGTPITASWANANVRDQVVTPFASAAARASAVTSPLEGMVTYLTDVDRLEVYNGAAWIAVTPGVGEVLTAQTSSSTTYANLGTVGPAVTINTGTKALVTLTALVHNTSADFANMSVEVSGATTLTANDQFAMSHFSSPANITASQSAVVYLASLTAGANTFTAKYRVGSGTGSWTNRRLIVQAIP
jgi:hypothetical protein